MDVGPRCISICSTLDNPLLFTLHTTYPHIYKCLDVWELKEREWQSKNIVIHEIKAESMEHPHPLERLSVNSLTCIMLCRIWMYMSQQNACHKAYEENLKNKVKDVTKDENIEKYGQVTYETNSRLLRLCFWNCIWYPWNARLGIEEFIEDSDITLLSESWEHDTQRIQGNLGNYNVHFLLWAKTPRQRRGQGGVTCLIKKEIEIYMCRSYKMMNINATYGSKYCEMHIRDLNQSI